MKVIDATWEKRNLGVTTYEIHLDNKDQVEAVEKEYEKLTEREYMVIRVPSSCHELVEWVQSKGYQFIEGAIDLTHSLKEIKVSKRLKPAFDRCSWAVMDDCDIEELFSQIESNIFKTDRVYLDTHFSAQQAARRYLLWTKDLLSQGHQPVKVLYDNKTIGFFLNSEKKPGVYDGILAGVYSGYEGTGMGFCVQYAGIKYAQELGAKKYLGHVSANNPPVMKCLLDLGFSVKGVDYIFIKHCKGE